MTSYHDFLMLSNWQKYFGRKLMQRIGEKLRALRKKRGMTLKELAYELNFSSHTYLIAIEQGKKHPSLELVYKIGKIFNVSYDQLLNDDLELDE